MEIRWIKLCTDIFDNRKIRQIEAMPDGDALLIIWLKLLVLAGNVNDGGLVYFTKDIPYTDQLLSVQFHRPLATVQMALKTFQAFGMIEITGDVIMVSNWEKYQNVDGMERVRELARVRKQNQRERERLSRDSHADVTQCHAIEEEREEEKEKERVPRFKPPTVEEVKAYCFERRNKVDAERFVDFYAAKGWKVGNQAMKDWKACVRTWERRDAKPEPKKGSFFDFDQRDTDLDEIIRGEI